MKKPPSKCMWRDERGECNRYYARGGREKCSYMRNINGGCKGNKEPKRGS